MDQLKNYYKEMGVEEKVFDYAQEVEKSIFQHNKSSKAAKDYMDLANEVIEKIGE